MYSAWPDGRQFETGELVTGGMVDDWTGDGGSRGRLMNRWLNEYLEKKGAKALDEGVLREYSRAMKEQTIPEIEKEIRKNEERSAELRFSPSPASRRQRRAAVGEK